MDISSGFLNTVDAHSEAVFALSFAPDGAAFATGSADATIKFWRPDSQSLLSTLDLPDTVVALAYMPDGASIVAGLAEHSVEIWNLLTGKRQRVMFKFSQAMKQQF